MRRDVLPVTRVIRPMPADDPLVSNTPDADAETTVDTSAYCRSAGDGSVCGGPFTPIAAFVADPYAY